MVCNHKTLNEHGYGRDDVGDLVDILDGTNRRIYQRKVPSECGGGLCPLAFYNPFKTLHYMSTNLLSLYLQQHARLL